jgi:hypothetical protein
MKWMKLSDGVIINLHQIAWAYAPDMLIILSDGAKFTLTGTEWANLQVALFP